MAKKKVKKEKVENKQKPAEEKKPGILDDVTLDIIAGVQLNKITLSGQRWTTTLQINATLPRAYHVYKITFRLDRNPFERRIAELERQMEGSLFKDDNQEKVAMMEKISDVKDELDDFRETCNTFEFSATVDALKYNSDGTMITFRIPDDVISEFNKHKHRMDLYEAILSPMS